MQVSPTHSDGRPLGDGTFVRTGLIGFLGPVNTFTDTVTLYYVRTLSVGYVKINVIELRDKTEAVMIKHYSLERARVLEIARVNLAVLLRSVDRWWMEKGCGHC